MNSLFRKVKKGFTLIEVLLAMAVFAIAGVALIGTADTHFRNLGHLETKLFANLVASNQLVDVRLTKKWPPKNNEKGTVELAEREWFWRQKVQETADENMRAVTIEVRLNEKSELAITQLMTYVAKDK